MSEYSDKDIEVLEGLDPVRKRPGMYIGGTDKRGLHHLVWEVVDNSVDEAMAGFADQITVTLHDDGSVSVKDNGRGIPMTPKETGSFKGIPTVELVATVLHAGGKFDGSAYSFSGGLHGVGLSVVNALSQWMTIDVERDKQRGHIEFAATLDPETGAIRSGRVSRPLEVKDIRTKATGTTVRFLPDPSVFKSIAFDSELISQRLRQTAFLNAGLTITLVDERGGAGEVEPVIYRYDNGLTDFMEEVKSGRLEHFAESRDVSLDSLTTYPPEPIRLSGKDANGQGEWDIALTWFPDTTYKFYAFANGIETPDGGTHVAGYQQVLTSLLNKYATQEHIGLLQPDGWKLEAQDVQSGLGVVVSVKVKEPQFDGQTKAKLNNEETRQMVRSGFQQALWSWMEENPTKARTFVEKVIREMEVRRKAFEAAEALRNKEGSTATKPKSMTLPAKLRDCRVHGRGAELFIVEGDSAGGSGNSARDPQYQAILPIRGKIRNVEKLLATKGAQSKLQENAEVQGIIAALGAGSQELFDPEHLRYERIVILTDADDDGRHIETLLIALSYRLFPGLIEGGHVYIARPPLFLATVKSEKTYLPDAAALEEFMQTPAAQNAMITRFKGLGEMSDKQLRESAMNPETRTMSRLDVADSEDASLALSDIMGVSTDYRWQLVLESETESDAM